MSQNMLLYDFPKSSSSYRVRIALNLKNIDYQTRNVDFRDNSQRSPSYLNMTPTGLIPTLQHNGHTICQSLAIIRYLDMVAPSPRLIPTGMDGVSVEELMLIIACDIHPINNLRVLTYLHKKMDQEQDHVNAWYQHWIFQSFKALEKMTLSHQGKYCFSDTITAADICLVPQMFNARRYDTPLDTFPNLVRIDRELNKIDAFAVAAPI